MGFNSLPVLTAVTSNLVQFVCVANQAAYNSLLITTTNVALVVYGQGVLDPATQYTLAAGQITITPGFDVEAGKVLTVFLR